MDSVVIGASWGRLIKRQKPKPGKYRYYYLHDDKKMYFDEDGITFALKSLEDMIFSISKHKKVFLVIDNPTGAPYDPKSLFSGSRLTGLVENKVYIHDYDEKQSKLRAVMIELATRSNAVVIDATDHFCNDGKCRSTLNNGWPLYKDTSHIRSSYVRDSIEYMDLTVKIINLIHGRQVASLLLQ